MDQKQSDVLTILHLIKSESEKTRKELSKNFETKMAEGFAKQKSELRKEMRQGFETQKQELKKYIDDKHETLRRKLVDDVQNFQDDILTEIVGLRQELTVNSGHKIILSDHESRLSKVEKTLFSN